MYHLKTWCGTQEKANDEHKIPVATPSRAQTMYWSKFKVAKHHYNPMLKSSTDPKTTPVVSAVAPPPADATMEASVPASTGSVAEATEAVAPHVPASTLPDGGAVAEAAEAVAPSTVPDGGATGSTAESENDGVPVGSTGEAPTLGRTDLQDEQWSQVSDSWLAKAYMNPDLKDAPGDGGAKPSVEAKKFMEDCKAAQETPSGSAPIRPKLERLSTLEEEFVRMCTGETLDPILKRIETWDEVEIKNKINQINGHSSYPAFAAYIEKTNAAEPYEFGTGPFLPEDIACFEIWCQAVQAFKSQMPAPSTPMSAVRAVLTRATTADLTPTPVAPKLPPAPEAAAPTVPVPKASAPAPEAPSLDSQYCSNPCLVWRICLYTEPFLDLDLVVPSSYS